MGWNSSLIATTLFASVVVSLVIPGSHVVHEKRHSTPSRWIKRDRVPSHAIFPVRVALTQTNLHNAEEYLMDVSHPASPNYGKHWTSDQVIDAFKPSSETVSAVQSWLKEAGIASTHSKNKAWLAFHATAAQMESLLHTEFHEYQDTHTDGIMPACEHYSLPSHISQHVDYVSPGIKLLAPDTEPQEHQKRSLSKRQWPSQSHSHSYGPHHPKWPRPMPQGPSQNLSTCDISITPACIAALYEIPPNHLPPHPDNSLGIFEAELQYWDQLDLDLAFTNLTQGRIPNGTHPITHEIDGGVAETKNVSAAGAEAMLDLIMSYPIVYPQTITVWNVDDIHYQEFANDTYTWGFNTLLDAIDGSYCSSCAYGECGNAEGIDPTYPDSTPETGYNGTLQCGIFKPANVFSLSYLGQEVDVPIAYQKRQCLEFLKLGLQGTTFLFAAGDAGVGFYPPPYGNGCIGPGKKIFNPTWPNNCPWVTSVGATKVYEGRTVFEPESAAFDPKGHPYHVDFSSGGGFSNVYPIPSYQKSAVGTFFEEHDPPYPYYSGLVADAPNPKKPDVVALAGDSGGIYNRIGRGIPDVSANGDNGAIYTGGEYSQYGGSSQATPIFASILNRINEHRLAAGKSTLGFVNPALYAHPEMMNDIKSGKNPGCGTVGFEAWEGWDPLTGLGTPNFPRMLEVFMSLP